MEPIGLTSPELRVRLAAIVKSAEDMAGPTETGADQSLLGTDLPLDLFTNIGMMVTTWAQAEFILDAAVSLILHTLDGKRRLAEPRSPVALKHKLDIWKKAHAKIPALKADAVLAGEVASEFTRLGQERHNVVHGTAMRLLPDGSFAYLRAYPRKGVIEPHLSTYTPEQIGDLAIEVVQLSIRIMGYLKRLVQLHCGPPEGAIIDSFIDSEISKPKRRRLSKP